MVKSKYISNGSENKIKSTSVNLSAVFFLTFMTAIYFTSAFYKAYFIFKRSATLMGLQYRLTVMPLLERIINPHLEKVSMHLSEIFLFA